MTVMAFHRFAKYALLIHNNREKRVHEEFCTTTEDVKFMPGRFTNWWK